MAGKLTASESEEHQTVDEEELDDIDDHAPERDLQRPQVRVYGEQVHQFEGTEENIKLVSNNNTGLLTSTIIT